MVPNSPDIAPWPTPKEQEQAMKKYAKEQKKAEKEAQKAKKKAEKAKKKAEKKALKEQKKVQKDSAKTLSFAPADTVTTIDASSSVPAAEATHASVPSGAVLAVCASLLVCVGSACLYRKHRSAE